MMDVEQPLVADTDFPRRSLLREHRTWWSLVAWLGCMGVVAGGLQAVGRPFVDMCLPIESRCDYQGAVVGWGGGGGECAPVAGLVRRVQAPGDSACLFGRQRPPVPRRTAEPYCPLHRVDCDPLHGISLIHVPCWRVFVVLVPRLPGRCAVPGRCGRPDFHPFVLCPNRVPGSGVERGPWSCMSSLCPPSCDTAH